jgi:hypothetical protein
MFEMHEKESGRLIGEISDGEMNFLIEKLEEESESDEDYYFDRDTLEFLKEQGMPSSLEQQLSGALGANESIEIIFQERK